LTKPNFESQLPVINSILDKRRKKWSLNFLADMDYEDVCQIIRLHIFKKWDQFDESKPIENWINSIITHQITNLIRNNYLVMAPPCVKCTMNQGGDLCGFTKSGEQCSECPLYRKWEKNKKHGYRMKFAVSLDGHSDDDDEKRVQVSSDSNLDMDHCVDKFHEAMRDRLPPDLLVVYNSLYVEHMSEDALARKLGLTSKTSGKLGYKQIYSFKQKILVIAKQLSKEETFV